MKLLKKEASERFLNARELIDALEDDNFHYYEEEDLSETAPIPIVVPKDKVTSKVYQQNYEKEQEEKEEEKEAVYVSNPDNKKSDDKNKKSKKLWPLIVLA